MEQRNGYEQSKGRPSEKRKQLSEDSMVATVQAYKDGQGVTVTVKLHGV